MAQGNGVPRRREFKVVGRDGKDRLGAAMDFRGHRSYNGDYVLEERFEKLVNLQAVRVLADASGGSGPNAAAFAAFAAANPNFEHLGTNTEVVTLANEFDFGGGQKFCTATADADSAINLPTLLTADSGWAVAGQWRSDRSPRFETVITPTPASQITTIALTSNVVLVTTGAAHGLAPGETVVIKLDARDADYSTTSVLEGTWVVDNVATTTTFTFAFTHANISSATIAGSCKQATNQLTGSAGIAIASIAVATNVVTITCSTSGGLSGKHGWGVDIVRIAFDRTSAAYIALSASDKAIVQACEGVKTLTSAYSAAATTFTYAQTIGDLTTANCTGTAKEVALNASLTKTCIWAGLKKTKEPVAGTDDDQVFVVLDTCLSSTSIFSGITGAAPSQYWQFVTSRAGVDTVQVLDTIPVPVMGQTYRIEIEIDANRIPTLYIDGVQVALSAASKGALTAGIDLIPYEGVMASGIVPAAKAITLQYLRCGRAA